MAEHVTTPDAAARTRNRWPAAVGGVAAGALILGLSASSFGQPAATPRDAVTLVRQALAALEVRPPDVAVATERVIKALLAQDTRGVNMSRVGDAAQALGAQDATTAAADLMEALRPAEATPAGVDRALLIPVQPRFAGTPAGYALLTGAAFLVAGGGFIARG
jgi:hypothetical protein